jgi:disulfide bond formation protein DsbB
MSDEQTSHVSCPCCGATDFIAGEVGGFGGLFFWPSPRRLFSRAEILVARKCNVCGDVQLLTAPMTPTPKRRWFQLSLVQWFVVMLILAVVVALVVPAMKHSENTPPPAAQP